MGYNLEVFTNSYEITNSPRQPYFQFDEILPDVLTKGRNYEIVDRLQATQPEIFSPRPVYDGRKALFCLRDIPAGEYSVAMGRDPSRVTHKVSIKRVSIIRPEDVKRLIKKRNPNEPFDANVMPLTLLQLIVRQAPNLRHGFPASSKSFYVASTASDLRCGLSAWRGYFQSVRPTLERLLINIDISHVAVYTPGSLINAMMMWLGVRNIRDLQDLDNPEFSKLRQFLKGVRIQNTLLPNARPRPISDLVRAAAMQEFDKDGGRTTVKRHFETKYNVTVNHPQLIGVKTGRGSIVPAEFCAILPGQIYRKKIPPQVQNEFLRFATQKPQERLSSIENAVRSGIFNYADSDFMKEAGMTVGSAPMSIGGQVVSPPKIQYGDIRLQIPEKSGAWNLRQRRFLQPSNLAIWAVVVYDNKSKTNMQTVQNFVSTLVGNLHKLGMTVQNPQPRVAFGNASDPTTILEKVGTDLYAQMQRPPELILVFLPENAADCRQAVKRWGDITRRVSTQCVRKGKWDRPGGGQDQYCNNVALKINSRLGGVNSILESPANQILAESMIIGADVGHPGPGSVHRPSITGLVASVDQYAAVMTSSVSIQRPQREIIEDLQEMIEKALNDWRDWRERNIKSGTPNLPPSNIIFYRDGVSDGEFAQVAQEEIPRIKEAFTKLKIPEKWHPKILFIVVTKRHHVRFFPKRSQDGDRTGNCPAGLLVDKGVTNPAYDDFYLQSHAGLLGTSRPSHYIVIHNETPLTKEIIQNLTFHLCHMYVSATRSVSIPAPVYYADKICQRLEIHCADGASLSDTASNLTASPPPFDLAEWKAKFKESGLNRRMYYI